MNKNVSAASLAIIKKMQQNELTESVIYEKIAKIFPKLRSRQNLQQTGDKHALKAPLYSHFYFL